jgi:NAD(P)-dependent dehydrogenase (short-subunit alcohol dehydrogenase family)
MRLHGKVSLITGGTRGIGAAVAVELARLGSDIAINGRHMDSEAYAVKERIAALGRRCLLVAGDMSIPDQSAACVHETTTHFERVDVLVHAAGQAAPGGLLEVSPESWYEAFDVHVHAVFHLCRAVVPVMKQKREGAIILISSAAGLRGCLGALAYGVAKGALPQFAHSLARELAEDNIRVNCVSPGIIRTRFQDHLAPDQVKTNVEKRIPLHREGTPEDVAELIAALVVNDFITGENVAIDGGMTMRIV